MVVVHCSHCHHEAYKTWHITYPTRCTINFELNQKYIFFIIYVIENSQHGFIQLSIVLNNKNFLFCVFFHNIQCSTNCCCCLCQNFYVVLCFHFLNSIYLQVRVGSHTHILIDKYIYWNFSPVSFTTQFFLKRTLYPFNR